MQNVLIPLTYDLLAAKKATKKQEPYKKTKNSKNLLKKCLESRWENGPKAEKGNGGRSNRTRENDKRADRKMESNDSPEIPDRAEDIKNVRPPFGPKELRILRDDFESIKHIDERTGRRDI